MKLRIISGLAGAGKIILGAILFILWIFFIPNTAYLVTDLRHIMDYCPASRYRVCIENSWMIMFFFTYSATGWVMLIYALNQMKRFLVNSGLAKTGNVFVLTIVPLISLGVLLGLINRNNSWDIFTNTAKVFADLQIYLTDLQYFKNLLVFIGFYYLLYLTGNFLFVDYDSLTAKLSFTKIYGFFKNRKSV